MDIKYNRVLIIDGSYMLHRTLSQPNNWDLINSKGKRTGGIFGVLRSLNKELKKYNFYPIVVFDGGLSERRLSLYPNYKRHQDKLLKESTQDYTEQDLIDMEFRREYNTQRNDLCELLPWFGIPVIQEPGWEGDDLIYILSKMCKNSIVVSDDKDLIQLIHQPNEQDNRLCRIWRPLREEFLDYSSLQEKGLDIQEYISCKSIVGDGSDNIPSACYQVGEKTALGLYNLYKCVNTNNLEFPKDEKELSKLCEQYNLPKRKAYLNFNENQFLINLNLTDLSLVDDDINEDIISDIKMCILQESNVCNNEQYIQELLSDFEINSFDYSSFRNRVSSLINLLDIENEDKCENIVETNQNTITLF